jgi:transcription antitermination factor NusG
VFVGDHHADAQQPRWYVLFVRSNQEKRVADALSGREIEHFLPCYKSVRQWKDRRVTLEIPLFPGYVFLRMPLTERAKALTVPNVVSLVGACNRPSAVSDEEIAWIRQGTAHGKAEPHPYLKLGQRIVVTDGVMCGMEGILVQKRNNTRVVVSLDSIMRAFVVEIDASCVRPLEPRHGITMQVAQAAVLATEIGAAAHVSEGRHAVYSVGA